MGYIGVSQILLVIRKTIYIIIGQPIKKIGEAVATMIATATHFTMNQ